MSTQYWKCLRSARHMNASGKPASMEFHTVLSLWWTILSNCVFIHNLTLKYSSRFDPFPPLLCMLCAVQSAWVFELPGPTFPSAAARSVTLSCSAAKWALVSRRSHALSRNHKTEYFITSHGQGGPSERRLGVAAYPRRKSNLRHPALSTHSSSVFFKNSVLDCQST